MLRIRPDCELTILPPSEQHVLWRVYVPGVLQLEGKDFVLLRRMQSSHADDLNSRGMCGKGNC